MRDLVRFNINDKSTIFYAPSITSCNWWLGAGILILLSDAEEHLSHSKALGVVVRWCIYRSRGLDLGSNLLWSLENLRWDNPKVCLGAEDILLTFNFRPILTSRMVLELAAVLDCPSIIPIPIGSFFRFPYGNTTTVRCTSWPYSPLLHPVSPLR